MIENNFMQVFYVKVNKNYFFVSAKNDVQCWIFKLQKVPINGLASKQFRNVTSCSPRFFSALAIFLEHWTLINHGDS